MRQLFIPLDHLAVTLEDAQTTLPAPTTSSDGEAITSWRSGSFRPKQGDVRITVASAVTLSSVALWEYVTADAKWYFVGYLNGGAAIVLADAAQGYKETFADLHGDRLALSATLSAAVATTVKATPHEVQE